MLRMSEPENKSNGPPRAPDWLDDDGDEVPNWAELPRLEIGDQASASMAIRFPALPPPTLAQPDPPALIPPPPGMIVVNDDFAGIRRLSKSFGQSGPRVEPPRIIQPGTVDASLRDEEFALRSDASAIRAEPIVYGIVVRNTTGEAMHDVRIEHDLPPGPRYLGADPPPNIEGRRLVWDVGEFKAGAKQRFKITIQPNRPDEVADNATAQFRVHQCLHSWTRVLRPAVTASVSVPEGTDAGCPIAIVVEAHNSGRGAAEDVRVILPLPAGLTHADGAVVQHAQPRLGPGERLRFETEVRAEHGGEFTVPAHVIGNGKILTSAQAILKIAGPAPVSEPTGVSPRAPGAVQATEPFLLFMLASDLYALPAGRVRGVRRAQQATPRPDSPEWLAGTIDFGTDSFPLIDLRRRLGVKADGPAARILLIESTKPAALLVDRALGVAKLAATPARAEFAASTAEHEGMRVTVLDLDRVVTGLE
jgi:chemotaxis signal transduction protein